jgi:hypothetical protein
VGWGDAGVAGAAGERTVAGCRTADIGLQVRVRLGAERLADSSRRLADSPHPARARVGRISARAAAPTSLTDEA